MSHKAEQRRAFRYQLQMAIDHRKPVVLHIRDAEAEAYELMDRVRKYIRSILYLKKYLLYKNINILNIVKHKNGISMYTA
jgi:Tat protein secretion system quality control protein TatD with DNase activity